MLNGRILLCKESIVVESVCHDILVLVGLNCKSHKLLVFFCLFLSSSISVGFPILTVVEWEKPQISIYLFLLSNTFHACNLLLLNQVLADIPTSGRFDVLMALIKNSSSSSMVRYLFRSISDC